MADRIFLYQASAFGFAGKITQPFQDTIFGQASCALPATGGYSQSSAENYRCESMMTVGLAKSQVIGNFSQNDKAYFSMASVTVEKINMMDMITCDRLTMRVSSKTMQSDKPVEPEITPLGCSFENLVIDGRRYDIQMATGLFNKYGTFSSLSSPTGQKELSSLILGQGSSAIEGYTMVGNETELGISNHEIEIPQFGRIQLARIFCTPRSRRVSMMEVILGCPGEGGGVFGGGTTNGEPFPP